MAVEVVVYCSRGWGGRGPAVSEYNKARAKILSNQELTTVEKSNRLTAMEYGYNARIQTGDLVSCRKADQGIGWNSARRVLVRIENMTVETMQRYVNESVSEEVTIGLKSGLIFTQKRRYKFTFNPMIVGRTYTFQTLEEAGMIDKTVEGIFAEVIR